jgi:RimJ/RimL family protein N-acetyltransferase
MNEPAIRKAAALAGKTLVLRDATPDDAAFILGLRTDAEKSAHLSPVSGRLDDQRAWLARYAQGTGQAYFIIEDRQGAPLGTVRLYDARGTSFCWGSWILSAAAPAAAAIESALMVYAYAIDELGFVAAHFQVHRANERVRAFHERFGAVRVAEDDVEFHYTLSADAIAASRKRYARYLPSPLALEPLPA